MTPLKHREQARIESDAAISRLMNECTCDGGAVDDSTSRRRIEALREVQRARDAYIDACIGFARSVGALPHKESPGELAKRLIAELVTQDKCIAESRAEIIKWLRAMDIWAGTKDIADALEQEQDLKLAALERAKDTK